MKVDVHINPLDGRATTFINGQEIARPVGQNLEQGNVAQAQMCSPARWAVTAFLSMLLWVRDFFIGVVVWHPPGTTGLRSKLDTAYMDKIRSLKGLDAQGGALTAKAEIPASGSALAKTGRFGDSVSTMEKIMARSDQPTRHATLTTPNGTQVRLTFFPMDKKVDRRVGVLVTNARGKPALNYVTVRGIDADKFSEEFPFCELNAMLLTKRDINEGLLNGFLELGTLPGREVTRARPAPLKLVNNPQEEVKDEGEFIRSVEGQIVRMETVTKQFGASAPYQTFEVVVRKQNTEEIEFNGKQLEEKAAAGEFKLYDVVFIGQRKVQMRKQGGSGKSFVSTSNSFKIKIIQSAA